MDMAVKPVQTGRGRRRRWSAEQKLIMLQEWQAGIPLEEICRKYAMNPAQMYRWKRSLEQGLKAPGELVQRVRCWAGEPSRGMRAGAGAKGLGGGGVKKAFELKGLT